MCYYHILVETLDRNNAKGQYSDFDKTDLEEIKEEYVTPFVKKRTLQINGYFIESGIIKRFQIKKTAKDLESYIQDEQKKMRSNSVFMPINKLDIFNNNRYSTDITKQLLKKVHDNLNMQPQMDQSCDNKSVFIVHGHDKEVQETVARFIEHLDLHAIILHEQANEGKTIIEKIEKHSDVGFGIVLYTPCDKGGLKDTNIQDLKYRARQNVVFEHGYLVGKLGRERVCALVKENVEIPNDLSGIVYIPMKDNWKLSIVKELKKVGYNVDANKIIE